MERHFALLMFSIDGTRKEEKGCEPERGAQGNKYKNHRFGKLDSVHLVLEFVVDLKIESSCWSCEGV